MTITVARSDDVAALSAVARATFLQTFADTVRGADILKRARDEDSPEAFARYLARGDAAWLATVAATDAPIGFALLCAPDLPTVTTHADDLELKRIYLLHRFHGLGAGLSLLNAVEAEARTRNASRLLLGVYHDNSVLDWYARQGFAQIGTRRFRVGDADFHDLILAKTLRPEPL